MCAAPDEAKPISGNYLHGNAGTFSVWRSWRGRYCSRQNQELRYELLPLPLRDKPLHRGHTAYAHLPWFISLMYMLSVYCSNCRLWPSTVLRLPVVSMTGAPCSWCLKHAGVQDTLQRLVALCAMLHDVDDWKYCSLPAGTAQKRSITFLQSQGADKGVIDTVAFVLDGIGFKESLKSTDGGSQDVTHHNSSSQTAQTVLHVVQDADRLDALGALSQELPAETVLNPCFYTCRVSRYNSSFLSSQTGLYFPGAQ